MATGKDVADVAEKVVGYRRAGLRSCVVGLVTFDITESGMCARFVRECHEAALGHAEQTWPYRGARALDVNDNLKAAGLTVTDRQRGDVVCFSGGEYGHIVVWLGDGLVAENTSSSKRGDPRAAGTKITPLADIGTSRIIGWYRPLPAADQFETAWQWAREYGIVKTVDYDPQIGRMLEILRRYAEKTNRP